MSDRRPPSKAGRPSARHAVRGERRGHATSIHDEHTDIAPRIDGLRRCAETTSSIHQVGSDDISLIDADERGPAPSDSGFKVPPHERLFVAPPAAIEHGSFGDPRSTTDDPMRRANATTDAMDSAERPVRVRKWRLGGDDDARDADSACACPSTSRVRTAVVALPAALDLHDLRRSLKDAELLLDSMNGHLTSRDIPAAKAELSAARHRIAEALALLARS